MSNWVPIVAILVVLAIVVALAMYFSVKVKGNSEASPTDFADTEPMMHVGHRAIAPARIPDIVLPVPAAVPAPVAAVAPDLAPAVVEPVPISPAMQAAQDNLNHKLWHQLVWRIPNTKWVQTQHQSLAEVQWLCLGPDHHHFIARAELFHDEWKWSFTKV